MKNKLLVKDWKKVLVLSMSFWAQVIGLLVLIVPELLFAYTGIDTDPAILWWAATLLLVFGLVGRLFRQGDKLWVEWARITSVLIVVTLLVLFASSEVKANERETLDVAIPLIARWEGVSTTAYLDTIAEPPAWTVCYGSTRGVVLGMEKTLSECTRLLREEVAEYRRGWIAYVIPEAHKYLHSRREAAYTSLAYNAGVSAIGRSTATRRLNSGNIEGGCHALGWWNRAGGRVVRGLVNRRKAEMSLCLAGL